MCSYRDTLCPGKKEIKEEKNNNIEIRNDQQFFKCSFDDLDGRNLSLCWLGDCGELIDRSIETYRY